MSSSLTLMAEPGKVSCKCCMFCVIIVFVFTALLPNYRTKTNRSGGVQGGISNGENIVIRVAFKPTSTIGQEQSTVSREGIYSCQPCFPFRTFEYHFVSTQARRRRFAEKADTTHVCFREQSQWWRLWWPWSFWTA